MTTLSPNAILTLPQFKRRTVYEVFPVSNAGVHAKGGARVSQKQQQLQQRPALYAFVLDPAEHGTSAVVRLRQPRPNVVRCDEFSNGQYRPESDNQAADIEVYDSLESLLVDGM